MLSVNLGKMEVDYKALDEFIKENIPSGMKVNEHIVDHSIDLKTWKCFEYLKKTTYLKKSIGTLGAGNHFIEIQEIIDDFTEYTGLRNYVCGNGRIARFINNPKVMRVVSAVWLMTCILLPIFVMLESYASDGYVSFQLIAFYAMWAFIMLVPFFKYHFVDKNRGDK